MKSKLEFHFWCFIYIIIYESGQIIATSAHPNLKVSEGKPCKMPLIQV